MDLGRLFYTTIFDHLIDHSSCTPCYVVRLVPCIFPTDWQHLLTCSTIPRFWFGPDPPIVARITILSNAIICVAEMWLGERFRQHMRDMRVLQCADYLIAGDALSFGRTSRGPIFLRGHDSWDDSGPDASPEIEEPELLIPIRPIASNSTTQEQSIVPWSIPVELTQNVLHHASLGPNSSWPTNKPLWITVDTEEQCNEVVHAVYDIISSSQSALALQVDTSRTHSIFWPLVHALVLGLAAFREELTSQPPKAFRDHLWCYPFAHMPSGHRSPYNRSKDVGRVIRELITIPLANRKDVRPPQRDIVLIVHGIRDKEQAGELYATITQLQKRKIAHAGLGFVAISLPTQLRRAIGDGNYGTMLRISTLYAGDNCVIYSGGKGLTPPAFYEVQGADRRWYVCLSFLVRKSFACWWMRSIEGAARRQPVCTRNCATYRFQRSPSPLLFLRMHQPTQR
ncbi:hypothetical protein B0H11DRAFT_2093747 [Mycena galericulata]|nr:hypothetical protein B0H11DRAFT_2093747 [Mycena galericulata]